MPLLLTDIRHGVRILLKSPGWTAVMSATLVLGIGLTTVMFSLAYNLLIRPLPYAYPERLIALWTISSAAHLTSVGRFNVGAANWADWRAQSKSFEDITLTRLVTNYSLTGDGPPERVQGARSWWNLLSVLGVRPLFGRTFTEEECRADAKLVLLSYAFWDRRFAHDPSILGRKILLNNVPFEVIGVMPRNFWYPTTEFQFWTPLHISPEEIESRWGFYYRAVGRLKPGVQLQQAQEEMAAIMRRLAQVNYASNGATKLGVVLDPLIDSNIGQFRKTLFLLLDSVGCLLLIVCINLGGLLMVRANARSHEFTVRAALGAGSGHLRRQMLAEILPLSLAGAAGGVLMAWLLLKVLVPLLPPDLLAFGSMGLDWPVLAAACIISVLVVLIAGTLPARLASRVQLSRTMQGSRTIAGGSTIRNLLVAGQIAITLVVVFAGGLLVRSLVRVMNVHLGFSTRGVLTMQLAVTRTKYPKDSDVIEYYRQIIARVKSIPGVTAVGMVHILPLSGLREARPLKIEGKPDEGLVDVDSLSVTPGYFSAMGIPLIRGRDFSDHDRQNTTPVGIVDEKLARKVFGSVDPLHKRFQAAIGVTAYSSWIEIVGVVGHTRNESLETDPRPQMYWPAAQQPQDRGALVVRTAGPPESFTSAVVDQIQKENPTQAVYDIRTMENWRDRSLQSRNLLTGLITLFGGSALLLACLGLYGVVSYSTVLRLREFAVRMAIGAESGDVRRLVLGHAIRLWLSGAAIGLVAVWPVGRLLKGALYGIGSADGISLAIAPFLLLMAALAAGLGPALRAARLDPAVILRGE